VVERRKILGFPAMLAFAEFDSMVEHRDVRVKELLSYFEEDAKRREEGARVCDGLAANDSSKKKAAEADHPTNSPIARRVLPAAVFPSTKSRVLGSLLVTVSSPPISECDDPALRNYFRAGIFCKIDSR
jgi:hypothetical protein